MLVLVGSGPSGSEVLLIVVLVGSGPSEYRGPGGS